MMVLDELRSKIGLSKNGNNNINWDMIKINDVFYAYDASAVRLINKSNDGKHYSNILEPFGFLYKCTVKQKRKKNNNDKVKIHYHGWHKRYDSWISVSRLLPNDEGTEKLAIELLNIEQLEFQGLQKLEREHPRPNKRTRLMIV